jgi:hypothetical protein
MIPSIIYGGTYKDNRGLLRYNNSFDASIVKRIYVIENNLNFIRGWQGHKIEQRWFSAIKGQFMVQLIKIDNWIEPVKELKKITFNLSENTLDVLHIPAGYITSIKSKEEGAKLLVMSDYMLNEISDNYKYPLTYFNQ